MHGSLTLPIGLQPIRAADTFSALRLAASCFGSEAWTIAFTFGWHAIRRYVPIQRPMVRSLEYSVTEDEKFLGHLWLVTSAIHGRHVCWGEISPASPEFDDSKLLSAARRLAGRRKLLLKAREPPHTDANLELVGRLGDTAEGFAIYSAPPEPGERSGRPRFHVRRRPLEIETQFHLARQSGRVIGMTGLYTCSFWPGMAWGGWGCLARDHARRDAAFELLAATEELARDSGATWFLIETSNAPLYRSARRIYELYGLELLLRIDGFYGRPEEPGGAWLVYGRRLKERPQ